LTNAYSKERPNVLVRIERLEAAAGREHTIFGRLLQEERANLGKPGKWDVGRRDD